MTDTTTPTQVQHPTRAAIRTAVQTFLPLVIVALAVIPQIIEAILDEQSIPGWLRGWLVILSGVVAAVAGIIARIMAIPAVNAWLSGVGLSAQPRPVDPPDISRLDRLDGIGQAARVQYPDGTTPPTGADGLQQIGRHEKDVDDT